MSRAGCWLLIAAALLGGCDGGGARAGEEAPAASRDGLEVVDDAGRRVSLPEPARRVVSLLPATTETLLAMGGGDRLVARTEYDVGLEHLPSVGGGLTPSLELIASLEPDLVIAWEESGAARVRTRLEALGIPVFAAQTRDTTDIFANIKRIGHLTGLDEEADSLAAWMRSELDAVRRSVAGRPTPSVLYVIGLDPVFIAGPRVFIGEILEVAGGRNLFPKITEASPQMSLEEIVRRRPDVVLIPTSGAGSATLERLRESPGWSELFRSGATRFQTLDADLLHRPGPNIVTAAWALRDALYPELAEGAR